MPRHAASQIPVFRKKTDNRSAEPAKLPSLNENADASDSAGAEAGAMPVICERILYYRKKAGLRQNAFCERIGASPNTVLHWEKGRTQPDVSFLPRICDALDITLDQLFGLPPRGSVLSLEEAALLKAYRELPEDYQTAVDTLTRSLRDAVLRERAGQPEAQEPKIREMVSLRLYSRSLAAGVGDPSEFEEESIPVLVDANVPWVKEADTVFPVNGDSMEPRFHNGDYVLVQRVSNPSLMKEGDIGAFSCGNEFYIKEYRKDGLHSLNPAYPTLKFGEDEQVRLLGRVLTSLSPSAVRIGT